LESQERADRATTKTVDNFYGANISSVLAITQSASVAYLPDVYAKLAAHGRKKIRSTIQRFVDVEFTNRCWSLNFVISPEIATKVQDWQILGDFMGNNISRGLHLLVVQVLDAVDTEETSCAWQRAAHWDAIQSGENSVSLQDAQVLLDNNKVFFPQHPIMLVTQVQICVCLFSVLFGPASPLTMAYETCAIELVGRLPQVLNYQLSGPHKGQNHLVSAVLSGKWQLLTSDWLERQERTPAALPGPDFTKVFSDMRLSENCEPAIPRRYLTPSPLEHLAPSPAPSSSPSAELVGSPAARTAERGQAVCNPSYDTTS
jgi:hypothetical protein